MKISRYVLATVFLATFFFVGTASVNAQFSITVAVDENGNGTLSNTSGFFSVLSFSMTADGGPGGLPSALTYNLLNPPGLTIGDLFLLDSPGVISDVIRFNPDNGGSLVFYSIPGGGSLADIGFPTANYTNTFSVMEINELAIYTPIQGQPGFVAGASGPVTYRFTSGVANTPEPSSILLFGTAVTGAVGVLRRRFRKR